MWYRSPYITAANQSGAYRQPNSRADSAYLIGISARRLCRCRVLPGLSSLLYPFHLPYTCSIRSLFVHFCCPIHILFNCHGVPPPAIPGHVPIPQAHLALRTALARNGHPSQHQSRWRHHVQPSDPGSSLPRHEQGVGCPECPYVRHQAVHIVRGWCGGTRLRRTRTRNQREETSWATGVAHYCWKWS